MNSKNLQDQAMYKYTRYTQTQIIECFKCLFSFHSKLSFLMYCKTILKSETKASQCHEKLYMQRTDVVYFTEQNTNINRRTIKAE